MNDAALAFERSLATRLRRLHVHLQIAHAGVVVAAAALRYQNCDHDEDIARVLRHCVGSRLAQEIEHTAELVASLGELGVDPADVETWEP